MTYCLQAMQFFVSQFRCGSGRRTDRPIIGRLSLLVQLSQRIILGYSAPVAPRFLRIGLAIVMLCHEQISPVTGFRFSIVLGGVA